MERGRRSNLGGRRSARRWLVWKQPRAQNASLLTNVWRRRGKGRAHLEGEEEDFGVSSQTLRGPRTSAYLLLAVLYCISSKQEFSDAPSMNWMGGGIRRERILAAKQQQTKEFTLRRAQLQGPITIPSAPGGAGLRVPLGTPTQPSLPGVSLDLDAIASFPPRRLARFQSSDSTTGALLDRKRRRDTNDVVLPVCSRGETSVVVGRRPPKARVRA